MGVVLITYHGLCLKFLINFGSWQEHYEYKSFNMALHLPLQLYEQTLIEYL